MVHQTRSTVDLLGKGRLREAASAATLPVIVGASPWWVPFLWSFVTLANFGMGYLWLVVAGAIQRGQRHASVDFSRRFLHPLTIIIVNVVLPIYTTGLGRLFLVNAALFVLSISLTGTINQPMKGGQVPTAWRADLYCLVALAAVGWAAVVTCLVWLVADDHCSLKDHWVSGCGDFGRNFTWV